MTTLQEAIADVLVHLLNDDLAGMEADHWCCGKCNRLAKEGDIVSTFCGRRLIYGTTPEDPICDECEAATECRDCGKPRSRP